MGDYDPHVDIDPIATARDGHFNVKEIDVEHSQLGILETPLKVIDAKDVNEELANSVKMDIDNPIFENWKFINQLKSFNKLHEILEQTSGKDQIKKLDSSFDLRKRVLKDSYTTLSLMFQRNPFKSHKFTRGISNPISDIGYEFLLDYIHSASSAFVLVPDIRIEEFPKFDDYISYVDESVSILSDFNSKPVFAPVPIKLNQKEFDKIIKHYKYQGYTNLWINFQASQISSTQFARVRSLLRSVERHLHLDRSVLYFSHVRKEVNRHPLDTKTVASDAISPFVGCDLLGISREPPAGGSGGKSDSEYVEIYGLNNRNELKNLRSLNRNRLFDPDSYYYYTIGDYPHELPASAEMLMNDSFNRIVNSKILSEEMNNSREYVKNQKNIKGYLNNKEAILKDINLSDNIIQGQPNQSKLLEFFKNR